MTERDIAPKEVVNTPLEIERKFIVPFTPVGIELDKLKHKDIIQGYLAISEDGSEVRLRKKGDEYFQTVKSGGTKTRTEVEIEINEEQFNSLWPLTKGKRIEKTRYEYPYVGWTFELDIYKGNLEGLMIAEVEFSNEEVSDEFIPPLWMGAEVTEDKRYKNQNLAIHGSPKSYFDFTDEQEKAMDKWSSDGEPL